MLARQAALMISLPAPAALIEQLEALQRLPVRLLGAVLNDVPAGAGYPYYYSYSYYMPGYEAVDEESGRKEDHPQVS